MQDCPFTIDQRFLLERNPNVRGIALQHLPEKSRRRNTDHRKGVAFHKESQKDSVTSAIYIGWKASQRED